MIGCTRTFIKRINSYYKLRRQYYSGDSNAGDLSIAMTAIEKLAGSTSSEHEIADEYYRYHGNDLLPVTLFKKYKCHNNGNLWLIYVCGDDIDHVDGLEEHRGTAVVLYDIWVG